MKIGKQLTILPKVHKNVKVILSQVRSFLKEHRHFQSLTSKNSNHEQKVSPNANHSSSSQLNISFRQKTLIQRYKNIREKQTPYRQIVQKQCKHSQQIIAVKTSKRQQRYMSIKQSNPNSLNKRSRVKSTKKTQLILSIIKNRKNRKNDNSLKHNLSLSEISQEAKQTPTIEVIQNLENLRFGKRFKDSPKMYSIEAVKSRRQSIKGFPYEPWQNKYEENDYLFQS